MKLKRSGMAVAAVALGVLVLTTSAFADVLAGSGYMGLKNAVKATSKFAAKDANSYTMNASFTLKEGDTVYAEQSETRKINVKTQQEEMVYESRDYSNYNYSDAEMNVWRGGEMDNYNVTIFKGKHEVTRYEDCFEEEYSKDLERLADAFAGSLQDVVQVEEASGGKVFTGNVDSSQIPMYLNALASLGVKYSFLDDYTLNEYNLPAIKNDIYVSSASGKAVTNKDGILTDAVFTAEFKGKDSSGEEHTLEMEILFSLTDINSTVIEKPDITNAEIYEESAASDYSIDVSEADCGKYVRMITDVRDGKRVKTGEHVLKITGVSENTITGTFTTEENGEMLRNIDIDAKIATFEDNYSGALFTYEENGRTLSGQLERADEGRWYVNLGIVRSDDGGYDEADETIEVDWTDQ